ncbi:MAG: serine protease [Burkholderiaceae bacterium]
MRWLSAALLLLPVAAQADLSDTIDKLKPSIVIVGTYRNTDSPRFGMRGTGFVAGDGNLVVTNAHVVQPRPDDGADRSLVVQVGAGSAGWQMRRATLLETDGAHDLALLRIDGSALPTVAFHDSNAVREGQSVAMMGFPIGGVLGFSPVTHRAMISSITPVSLPAATGQQLSAKVIRSLRNGSFNIFQLDGTAYPGNSGGPLFDPETGAVIGVVNMVFVKGTKESAITHPSGISYAIPSSYVRELIRSNRGG